MPLPDNLRELLHFLKREASLTEWAKLASDSRIRAACFAVDHVARSVAAMTALVDPIITDVPKQLSEKTLALANKTWFVRNHANLVAAMSDLNFAVQSWVLNLGDMSPDVLEAVDLIASLQRVWYGSTRDIDTMTAFLASISTAQSPGEILELVSELRKTWTIFDLRLNNQVIVPSTSILVEIMRNDMVTELAGKLFPAGDGHA
jgi:hypothetical protein